MHPLQVVMLYCGLGLSLRSCAGEITQLMGYLSDSAIKIRLSTCSPWVKALLAGVFDLINVTLQQVEVTTDKKGGNLGHYGLKS